MHCRIRGYVWTLIIVAWLAVPTSCLAMEYFLFTSFRGNGEDGLHLAWSTNGYQ